MKVLFTSMNEKNVLSVCDLTTRQVRHIPTPMIVDDHRPFGITWDRDSVYVAQPTSIWQFDRSLNFQKVLTKGMWYGTHQILSEGDCLWAVSPRINGVYRINGKKKDCFFPDEQRVGPLPHRFRGKDPINYSEDTSHYNSILIKDGRLYLSAHNHDHPSFIKVFKYPELEFIAVHKNLGHQIHNILVDGNSLFTLDSLGTRSLMSTNGKYVKVGKEGEFVRGLAATKDWIVTSCFPYDPVRHKRRDGHSEIVVINRHGLTVEDRIVIKDVGNINDIRFADELDDAHGKPPLWNHMI